MNSSANQKEDVFNALDPDSQDSNSQKDSEEVTYVMNDEEGADSEEYDDEQDAEGEDDE